jgi:hypothetical protein
MSKKKMGLAVKVLIGLAIDMQFLKVQKASRQCQLIVGKRLILFKITISH